MREERGGSERIREVKRREIKQQKDLRRKIFKDEMKKSPRKEGR